MEDLPDSPALDRDLLYQLWQRILERLRSGESLITTALFQQAMEQEYQALTGQPVSALIRRQLQQVIVEVNTRHPETYLTSGVRNAMTKAFQSNSEKLHWSLADIQARGTLVLRRFARGPMRDFFLEQGVDVVHIDPVNCVRAIVDRQTDQPPPERPPAALAPARSGSGQPTPAPEPRPTPATPHLPAEIASSEEMLAALEEGLVDAGALRDRMAQQTRERQTIAREENQRLIRYLDTYVKRGLITPVEAQNLRKLQANQTHMRRSDSSQVRTRIEKKLRPALDYSILYLEIYDALKRLPGERDPALKFLIRHKHSVAGTADPLPAMEELRADEALFDNLLEISARTDKEVCMLSLRLPPYGQVLKRDEVVKNLVIEEGFVDALRNQDREALSARLNDPEDEARVRPAADVKCALYLIDQLVRLTRFCQEMRILKIARQLEEFAAAPDIQRMRQKIEQFLKRRLLYLYPDLTPYEKAAVERRAEQLLSGGKEESAAQSEVESGEGPVKLDQYEIEMGVQIARVATRVAGRTRHVPYKIMPDKSEPHRYIIVRRDPQSGAVIPAMQRGAKRYVEKDRDGFWRMAR